MNAVMKTAASLVLLGLVFLAGMGLEHKISEREVSEIRDTVFIWNTVESDDIPEPAETAPAADTVPLVVVSKEQLLPSEDSSCVSIIPEVRTWRDTLPTGISYEIQATGVGTSLTHVGIIWPERQISTSSVVSEPYQGWQLFAVGQTSFTGFSPEHINPFAGLELEYTSGIFSCGGAAGVQWERPPGATTHSPTFRIEGNIRIRLCRF